MNELSPYFIRRITPLQENTATSGRPFGEESEGPGLWDYWRVIRKRAWLIGGFLFGVVIIAAVVLFAMTPIYTAKTTLLIERKAPRVLDMQQVLFEPVSADEEDYYKTQYAILESRRLVVEVIREQGLDKNALFTSRGREEEPLARLWSQLAKWLGKRGNANQENPLGIDPQVIDTYIDEMLTIEPVRGTRLVEITFSTPDPALSARVANAHAEAYIRQGLKLHTLATQEAQRFLEKKLVELKARLEKSEDALNRYRRDEGIISLDEKENIVVERLADLNKRLTEAEAEHIGLEAQVQLIRMRDYDSLPAVIGNTLIQTLKAQLVRLEGEHANLAIQFKSGYPRLAQLKAQLEENRNRLMQEINRVVGGTESAYLAARAKEKELRARMGRQKAEALAQKDSAVKYAMLAREVDTNRQLHDSVLQRMKQIGVAAELRASNIFVIDGAEPPRKPSKPRKEISFLVSILLGVIGGVGLAFLLEHLDNTLKSPKEVESYLRVPNLGLVPDFLSLGHSSKKTASGITDWVSCFERLYRSGSGSINRLSDVASSASAYNSNPDSTGKEVVLLDHPLSLINEAYRTLRTAILLSRAGEPPKTILFTSAAKGEGKTATVINTAIIFAQMGVKVLVVDADLRHPSCHKALGLGKRRGLTELLTGQKVLEFPQAQEILRQFVEGECNAQTAAETLTKFQEQSMIQHPAMSNLFLLSCGSIPPNPTELVGSRKMHQTLISLQEHFDYILIDSPPVLSASDAVLLSTMVDGVVLVVSGRETPKQVVKAALSRLAFAQAKILGVALNRVDMRSGDYPEYYVYRSHEYSEAEDQGTSVES